MLFKKGDILFKWYKETNNKSSNYKLINKAIYSFQKFETYLVDLESYRATHMAIIIGNNGDYYIVGHSMPNGFIIQEFHKNYLENEVQQDRWRVLRFNDIDTEHLQEHAESLVGTPYSYFDYLKFIGYLVFGIKLLPGSLNSMVCSESGPLLLYMSGIDIRLDINKNKYKFDYITPGFAYDRCLELGAKRIWVDY